MIVSDDPHSQLTEEEEKDSLKSLLLSSLSDKNTEAAINAAHPSVINALITFLSSFPNLFLVYVLIRQTHTRTPNNILIHNLCICSHSLLLLSFCFPDLFRDFIINSFPWSFLERSVWDHELSFVSLTSRSSLSQVLRLQSFFVLQTLCV